MKHMGIAKITNPTLVSAKVATLGGQMHQGAIFIEIPELGFLQSEGNLIYCRYGMSVPYILVNVGDHLWVEPTIGHDKRFIYTGFADIRSSFTPASTDTLILDGPSGQTIKVKSGVIYFSNTLTGTPTENIPLGVVLKTLLSSWLGSDLAHTHPVIGAVTGPPSNAATLTALKASPVDDSAMLSNFVKTEKG